VALPVIVNLDMNLNQILNLVLQQLASDPSSTEALVYYNTTSKVIRYYNGTAWRTLSTTAGTVVGVTGTSPIIVNNTDPTNPVITEQAADATHNGYLSQTDYSLIHTATDAATNSALMQRDASGRAKVTSPSAATDIANKGYVDNLVLGAEFKDAARAVATANVASLSGTTTLDGVSLIATDRVLLTGQTTGSQNGIWVIAAGAWTRPADFNTGDTIPKNRSYFVAEGTLYHDSGWTLTNDTAPVVGTDASTWTRFTGLGEVTAGNGLTKSDVNTLAVLAADSTVTVASGGISVTSPKLKATTTVGNASATSFAITHNLGTRDVIVTVYRNSTPWDTVLCDVERTDANTVTVKFATAPTSNQFAVVILG
jgi:hypothetical protein